MTDTDPIQTFAAAWTTALAAMTDVVKDQTVKTGSYSYTYADLKSVLTRAREVLSQYGLAISQQAHTINGHPAVSTIVWHRDGHSVEFSPLEIPAPANAQAIGSAITYARRYTLMAVLGMATEDDDGQAAQMRTEVDLTFDADGWLKEQSQRVLKDWTANNRREAWKAAVAELEPSKPMTKTEAEKVLAHMTAAYYADKGK